MADEFSYDYAFLSKRNILIGGLFLLAGAAPAKAQLSTNCMAMGSNMVHCDTMDMTQPGNDGGAVLGRGIGELIARSRENSFRKKVGEMLANNDCVGASRFAYQKGRLELGAAIAQYCSSYRTPLPSQAPTGNGSGDLDESVRRIASDIHPPISLDEVTTLSNVEAAGNQLRLTAKVDRRGATITDSLRTSTTSDICGLAEFASLLRNGASIRAYYVEREGRPIGTITVTRQECGF